LLQKISIFLQKPKILANTYLIKNAIVINEGISFPNDILIKNSRIERIDSNISLDYKCKEINAEGLWLVPGVIDDQVHFREPGLTHKANIESESRAAVLGGVTSYMEMPNTNRATLTKEKLEEKYTIAALTSASNYSFFFGASNNNIEDIKRLNPLDSCGVKIFMGSSTGNMLVDNEKALSDIFEYSPTIIATHCEDEDMIIAQKVIYKNEHNSKFHPIIRDREACIASSKKAIELAKRHNSRLHILHISTKEEVELFEKIPLKDKRITAEACVHHLWFSDQDYEKYGNKIVCNPALKTKEDREALWQGLLNGNIDVIATDHAPHTWEEKSGVYPNCTAGVPLIQHPLLMMLEKVKEGKISIEMLVDKMSHKVADLFEIKDRGYIREGYYADLVLVNLNKNYLVSKDNITYKCGWSPFEGHIFSHSIDHTFVSGILMQQNGKIINDSKGKRLEINRS
jgi:dihydroorotase